MRQSLSACRLTWFCSDVLDSPALQDSLNPIDRALRMGDRADPRAGHAGRTRVTLLDGGACSRASRAVALYDPLRHHGVGELSEACDVCSNDVVAALSAGLSCIVGCMIDALHDVMQFCIHFFERPGETLGVL